jgi:hypothetical protein
MEEEKRKRRVKQDEDFIAGAGEYSIPIKNKMGYVVVLVTPVKVIYRISDNNCSSTPNIWGAQLKPGDKIYL